MKLFYWLDKPLGQLTIKDLAIAGVTSIVVVIVLARAAPIFAEIYRDSLKAIRDEWLRWVAFTVVTCSTVLLAYNDYPLLATSVMFGGAGIWALVCGLVDFYKRRKK